MKKILLLCIFVTLQMLAACQVSSPCKFDSLKIDSIAIRIILTDSSTNWLGDCPMEMEDHLEIFDKVYAAVARILKSRLSKSISDLSKKTSEINKGRRELVDSLVNEIKNVQYRKEYDEYSTFQYRIELANILFQTGDSLAVKHLFDIGEQIFDSNAWHSDYWAQYPVLRLVYRNSQNNLGYYPYVQERLMKNGFDDHAPIDYLYSQILRSIFYDEEELLYIKLNKLLQRFPENDVLKANVRKMKSILLRN